MSFTNIFFGNAGNVFSQSLEFAAPVLFFDELLNLRDKGNKRFVCKVIFPGVEQDTMAVHGVTLKVRPPHSQERSLACPPWRVEGHHKGVFYLIRDFGQCPNGVFTIEPISFKRSIGGGNERGILFEDHKSPQVGLEVSKKSYGKLLYFMYKKCSFLFWRGLTRSFLEKSKWS